MTFTLRQFQKAISAAKKIGRVRFPKEVRDDVSEFISEIWDKKAKDPFLGRHGRLRDMVEDITVVESPARTIDSMARRYGPNTPITQFLRRKEPQPESGVGNSDESISPPEQQSAESDPPEQQSAESDPPAHQEEEWVPTPPEPTAATPKTREEQQADKVQQLREQLRELKAEAKQAAQQQNNLSAPRENRQTDLAEAIQQLQERVKKAARRQSKLDGRRGQSAGPSLESRRRAAGAHGRLQRVSPALRNKTAEIINRLVSDRGTAGDRLTPIPVLSPRKVVKRMVVRRSLSNALKEDCNAGRPVTLFLPDVSWSCEVQAQIACDISNAAGYAGVSGSDVLVFPHSNGEVEAGYVPWFNGRPKLVPQKEVTAFFRELTAGRSGYDIRVVVAIGDHDAEALYREIAERREVKKLVWLHNHHADSRRAKIVPREHYLFSRLNWSSTALDKTTLVAGCVGCSSILAGLELAIK